MTCADGALFSTAYYNSHTTINYFLKILTEILSQAYSVHEEIFFLFIINLKIFVMNDETIYRDVQLNTVFNN